MPITEKSGLLHRKKVEVPNLYYDADFSLHDRYHQFSAELLKLSLGGIAAFGLVVGLLGDKQSPESFRSALQSLWFLGFAIPALFSLVAAAAFSLLHRFTASDGLFHHLRALKLMILLENPRPDAQEPGLRERVLQEVDREEATRNLKLRGSGRFLAVSGGFLALGGVLFCLALTCLLAQSRSAATKDSPVARVHVGQARAPATGTLGWRLHAPLEVLLRRATAVFDRRKAERCDLLEN